MTSTEFAQSTTAFARSTRPVAGLVVSVSAEGAATVVALRGEADLASLPVIVEMLARVIADHEGGVVVDLGPTDFINSATIRALGRAAQLLDARGRQLRLRSPSRLATRVLAICGLSHRVEPGGTAEGLTAAALVGPTVLVGRS